jgi:tetratricopeptide (TPR) repeat protein
LVFQNKELGSLFNQEFINFRITPSDEDWQKIRGLFEIRGTPTVVLIKPDGEELDRINGFDGADEFVASVKEYLAGNNLLTTFISQVEENSADVEANFNLGKKYSSRWEDDKAYPYYAKTVELDPEDSKGFKAEASLRIALHMIEAREDPDPEPLKQFIDNNTNQDFMFESYASLARYYQRKEENDKVMPLWDELLAKMPDNPNVMNEYAFNVFSLEDESRYDRAKALAEKALSTGDEDALFLGHYNIIRYYRLKKDNDTALVKYAEAAEKVPTEAFFAYGYAAVALQEKKTDLYDSAIEMARKAIEINDGVAAYWDTLAALYFEQGENEEAVKAQEKALELMPDNQAYQKKLETYKGIEKK